MTHAGIPVAVKVQYPGVDDAIRADLVNTDLLSACSRDVPRSGSGPLVDELRERLTEELDYRNEASNQRFFAEAYCGHPFISVPPSSPSTRPDGC